MQIGHITQHIYNNLWMIQFQFRWRWDRNSRKTETTMNIRATKHIIILMEIYVYIFISKHNIFYFTWVLYIIRTDENNDCNYWKWIHILWRNRFAVCSVHKSSIFNVIDIYHSLASTWITFRIYELEREFWVPPFPFLIYSLKQFTSITSMRKELFIVYVWMLILSLSLVWF